MLGGDDDAVGGEGFDGFPMWSPDGKTFVFCSNRANSRPGETNVFVADFKWD